MSPLRLLSINTWTGYAPRQPWRVEQLEPPGHKERRQAALLEGIRAIHPDVLFLQECLPQPGFSHDIARALGYDEVSKICNAGIRVMGWGLPSGVGGGEGLAILAKPDLGLEPLGVHRLSGIGFTTAPVAAQLGPLRFALAAGIRAHGTRIVLVNTHLRYAYPRFDAFDRAWKDLCDRRLARGQPGRWLVALVRHSIRVRDRELRRLVRWVDRWVRQRIPVIIGADLNLDYDASQTLHFAERLSLLNVLPTTGGRILTWDPEGNPNVAYSTGSHHPDGTPKAVLLQLFAHYDQIPQTPDHIFIGPTFPRSALREAAVALDRAHDGAYPSDHYAVFAEIRLPTQGRHDR